jgi:PAS domain S-box-containing protein
VNNGHVINLADALPEAVLIVAVDGLILDANRAAISLLCRPLDAIIGHGLLDISSKSPDALKAFLHASSRSRERVVDSLTVASDGVAVKCRAEGFLLKPRQGEEQPQIMVRLLPSEATTGRFLALNERIEQLTRAIAAQKRAEDALRQERELLEVTLKSVGDAVIVTDLGGIITFLNSVAEELTGWALSDAVGQPLEHVFRIVNEHTGYTVENPVGRVLREGKVVGLANHTILIARDRTKRPIDDSGAPIRDANGRLRGVVLVFRDVSERKAIEDEREQLLQSERAARSAAELAGRMKDEFLATLSHELRTPLNAILGYATLLQMGSSSEDEMQEAIATIAKNARLQAQLIEDLLDMNRIISGKVRLDVQAVDLAGVIDAALETVRPSADAKGLRIRRILDPLAGAVRGDPSRLQQIVWNLLSNAVKFTPKGGQVQVSLERANSHVEITVTDTGQGITPEFLPHVFDRFRQADSSSTRHFGGLGLGLSIVKQLVELHGGTVRAKSPGLNQGASFVVSLPLAVLHLETGISEEHRSPKAEVFECKPDLSGICVLTVDDEIDACKLVVKVLEECHCKVDYATSAEDALRLLPSKRYNVLISDIGMPGQDGYELIRKVRTLSKEQGGGDIPAIALTAFARSEDRQKAALAGFQTHLAKPVEAMELLAVVANLAGRTGT